MTNLTRLETIKLDLRSLLVSRNSQNITLPFLNKLYKNLTEQDIPYTDFNFTSLREFLNSMPKILYLKNNKNNELCVYHIESEQSKHISRLVSLEKTENSRNKKMQLKNNVIDPSLLNQILLELCESTPQNGRNKKVKKIDVLSSIENKNGNYTFYTTKDLNNQLNELDHILYYNDDYIYFKAGVSLSKVENKNKKKDDKNNNDVINNSVSCLIKQSTKERLKKLIQKHPDGMKCCDLPKIYQREYKFNLEYTDLGFNSIIEFVRALPDILKIVTSPHVGQQLVVEAETVVNSYRTLDTKQLPQKMLSTDTMSLNSGKFFYNETIDQVCLKTILTDGQNQLDIVVSEVCNPSFFWVRLRKNGIIITKLMKNLQEFYENQDLDSCRIPLKLVKPGLHVACIFNNQWHRGIVKNIKPGGPWIHFYDYGTNKIYNYEDLYFLNQQFSVIPAQAIPCTLHNVKPVGANKWPSDICEKFLKKVFNKLFIAYVLSIDYKRNCLEVNLLEKSSDLNNINVNSWMIENQIAEWGTPIISGNIFTLKCCKQYLQNLSPDLLFNDTKNAKQRDTNYIINSVNSKIYEKCTTINPINFNKKLEILRKYKTNKLNNSLESSCNSS